MFRPTWLLEITLLARSKAIKNYTKSRSIVRLSGITFPTTFRDSLLTTNEWNDKKAHGERNRLSAIVDFWFFFSITISLRPVSIISLFLFRLSYRQIITTRAFRTHHHSHECPPPAKSHCLAQQDRNVICKNRLFQSSCAFVRPNISINVRLSSTETRA